MTEGFDLLGPLMRLIAGRTGYNKRKILWAIVVGSHICHEHY